MLDCHEKIKLYTIASCKDVTSKHDKKNSTRMDYDGIKIELILDSSFEVVEQKKYLLEINVMCSDKNVGNDKHALTLRKKTPSEILDASHVKNMETIMLNSINYCEPDILKLEKQNSTIVGMNMYLDTQ